MVWHAVVATAFVVGSARELLFPILEPGVAGSHAVVYTEAARAWLVGGDPWSVGPPAIIFAGPPTMLLPFAPFTLLPDLAIRILWIAGAAGLALWVIRRLRLPAYWLLFPPLSSAIILGHPEVLVLALVVATGAGGMLSGLAPVIKPYAALALLAQWRWRAIAVTVVVVALTALVLPWSQFISKLPEISANLARQSQGESTFGNPLLMALAVGALLALGVRRALWLATPLLWPAAQPGYKLIGVPALSPILAVFWALPIPGATLAGVLVEAALRLVARRRSLPAILQAGLEPVARPIPGATGPIATPPLVQRVRGRLPAWARGRAAATGASAATPGPAKIT